MNYYFFGATLPHLFFEEQPPITEAEYRRQAGDYLGPDDLRALVALHDESVPCTHPFVVRWRATETQIRNALARIRAANAGIAAESFIHPGADEDVFTEKRIGDICSISDPRAREHALDALRWRLLDSIEGLEPFSSSRLLAYGLKIRLASRWAALNREQGQAELDRLVSSHSIVQAAGQDRAQTANVA